MTERYNVIVIGGGHNGLTAAATLAKAGRSVLVLEQRAVLGGIAATEEIFPGHFLPTGADDAGLFFDEIADLLELEKHGLSYIDSPALLFSPQLDGRNLTIWRDDDRTQASLAALSVGDGQKYLTFRAQVEQMAGILRRMARQTPPDLFDRRLDELTGWGHVGLATRQLGKTEMMDFMRVLPLSVQNYLEEWFESEALQGALAASGVTGLALGPRAAGTNLMFLYQSMQGLLQNRPVAGGIGRLSAALSRAATAHGATIRTGVAVKSILLNDQLEPAATGVRLSSGEEIYADSILSSADPRRTLLEMAGPQALEPETMRQYRNIIYRGTTAKVLLIVDRLPEFMGLDGEDQLSGRIRLCPSPDYLEKASDAAKYGRYSDRPYLEIHIPTLLQPELAPDGRHILSITARYAPYHLKRGTWQEASEPFTDSVVAMLAEFAPGAEGTIIERHTITPADLEFTYGLSEGSIHQGQMGLDQLLIMRPIPGWARYETPVRNLYLCGAGAHPGGGVTGAPGYNAARMLLKQRTRSSS